VSAAADALGVLRLGAALAYPGALASAAAGGPASAPLGLFAIAAATDFADGVVARWTARPSVHGAVLDVAADVAFVLGASAAAARLGMISWLPPAAIAAAVAAYAVGSFARTRRERRLDLARSRLGHAAGVINYALVGLVSGAVAVPGRAWPALLAAASAVVVVTNVAAVGTRLLAERPRRDTSS
jgi:phosphatidylglycerophosphate synthase